MDDNQYPRCVKCSYKVMKRLVVKFVEELCIVFDERCCFVDQRFEIVVKELRDAFGGVTVT